MPEEELHHTLQELQLERENKLQSALEQFEESHRDTRAICVRFGARGVAIRYRLCDEKVVIARVWHALGER